MIGHIHSIETMGLMDGPGVRTVFFLQGCPLKCSYCHNPDTQCTKGGKAYTVDDIVKFAKRYKPYYKNNGGVTFSGGEALMQGAFVLECFKALKAEGIHTVLDTSGVGQTQYYEEILHVADMVILDVKHFDKSSYLDITGVSMKWLKTFLEAMKTFKGDVWLRHVMVPGVTDSYDSMDKLYDYIVNHFKSVEKIEILPYHKLGVDKYSQMNLTDPMEGISEMDKDTALMYQNYLASRLEKKRAIAV